MLNAEDSVIIIKTSTNNICKNTFSATLILSKLKAYNRKKKKFITA